MSRVECDTCPRSIGCETTCMKAGAPAQDGSGYVNVHGAPVAVDFRALVQKQLPNACVREKKPGRTNGDESEPVTPHFWVHEDDDLQLSCAIGAGATPETAWRDAHFRLLERQPALDDGEDNSDYQ